MIEDAERKLDGITNGLIQRVMAKLDDSPEGEALFLRWADQFSEHEPFNRELWDKLKTHVQWPI